MALKPLLRAKVDELFLLWLSEPDTQNLLRSSLSQVIRGEPVTRPANQLSALVKPGNGGAGRQQAPKSPRIRPSSPPHLPTNVPSPRNRARHPLNVCVSVCCIIFHCHSQAHREGRKGRSFPVPRDVWRAPTSLKNTENDVPDGFFLT